MRERILTEDLSGLLVQLSLPAIIGMSISGINVFVDALFVGQYLGEAALAGLSLAFPLTMITNAITSLIGVGTASLLSIALGNKEEDIQRKSYGTLLMLVLLISIPVTILTMYFAEELIGFLGGTGEILRQGVIYYRIMMFGAILRIYAIGCNIVIRAEGKVKEAMIYSSISVIVNIILNPIFLGVLDMGISGVAWATFISMVVFTLFNVYYFYGKKTSYPIDFTYFKLESKLVRPIIAVGASAMLLQIYFLVRQVVIYRLIAIHGTDSDIAFMGATLRIMLLIILPIIGFSQAFQPVVGINYGANQLERVQSAFKIFASRSIFFMVLTTLILLFFPTPFLRLMLPNMAFTSTDLNNFRLMMVKLPVFPLFILCVTLFQSIGNATISAILQSIRDIFLFVPIVIVFANWFGVSGIYAASIPVDIIVTIIAILYIRRQFITFQQKNTQASHATVG